MTQIKPGKSLLTLRPTKSILINNMLFIFLIIFWIVGGFSIIVMIRRLRTTHESVWIALGRPAFGATNSFGSGFRLLWYILRLRFRMESDPLLVIGGALSLAALLGCATIGIAVVLQMF